MERTEWLGKLEALHVRLRGQEPVGPEDLAWYQSARERLLATALEVQAVSLASSAARRSSIRVARPAQVLLEARGWSAQSLTSDLGGGGFATLLEAPPPVTEWIRASLLLPGGPPVVTTVAVADARPSHGLVRVAFRFSEPTEAVRRQVEDSMLDNIIEQLVFWDDVLEHLHA